MKSEKGHNATLYPSASPPICKASTARLSSACVCWDSPLGNLASKADVWAVGLAWQGLPVWYSVLVTTHPSVASKTAGKAGPAGGGCL